MIRQTSAPPELDHNNNNNNARTALDRRRPVPDEVSPTIISKHLSRPADLASILFTATPVDTDQLSAMNDDKPKFLDYLSGGMEMNLVVAIDFTGSNGDPGQPGTLHYIDRNGVHLNDYEKALTAVGSVIAKYDSDKKFPVRGFGAKINGVVQHCFQVGDTPELHGISGILKGYRGVFQRGFNLSKPTVFAEVIDFATRLAQRKEKEHAQSYTVLLILTDGAVTDIEQTKEAIRIASKAPLSIVIVGIGNADFSKMKFLDEFHRIEEVIERDIVKFVEFNRHQHSKESLTRETLEEIPDQVVNYFYNKNIMPLPPPVVVNESVMEDDDDDDNIAPKDVEECNEKEDLDLEMEILADGEIRLKNPERARWDNHSFESGASFASALETPPSPKVMATKDSPSRRKTLSPPSWSRRHRFSSPLPSPSGGGAADPPGRYSSDPSVVITDYASLLEHLGREKIAASDNERNGECGVRVECHRRGKVDAPVN